MHESYIPVVLIALTFVLAGVVKGVTGMGLPTVAIALLGLVVTPSEAAALLVIPALVTNVWQFAAGPYRGLMLRRMWPMIVAISAATWASAGLIAGDAAGWSAEALGGVLVIYAVLGLAKVPMRAPKRAEPWLSPIIGAATGVVTGATGVFVIPAVPYLQSLGLDKEELVQALGFSFTASSLALAAGLASSGSFHIATAGASVLYTAPALVGVFVGQSLRARVNPAAFRLLFFLGLLVLGGDLMLRSMF